MEKRNPWAWIPSLYFAEGLPYVGSHDAFCDHV